MSLPAHERRLIAAAVLGWQRAQHPVLKLTPEEQTRVDVMSERRLAGEPLQHITGEAFFRNEVLAVGPGVFVPRPETEVMTGWVIDALADKSEAVVVELCAGSGAISRAIATEAPGRRQYAVELSDDALPWLERNLSSTEVTIVAGDMATACPELNGVVDVVVCNPPYIPLEAWEGLPTDVRDYDPTMALFSGVDGLDAMRTLAAVSTRLLKPGGLLAAEHAEVQHESVVDVFVAAGFSQVLDHQDLTGRWRFVTATRL